MNIRTLLVAAFAFCMLLSIGCGPGTSTLTRGDNDVIAEINDRIRKDPRLGAHYRKLNVTSVNGSVKVFGYVEDEKTFEALQDLFNTPVAGMNGSPNLDVYKHRPLPSDPARPMPSECVCPGGYQACGDICIPQGDKCSIGAGCLGITKDGNANK